MRLIGIVLILGLLSSKAYANNPEQMIANAEGVFSTFFHDPEQRANMQDLLARSEGLIIVTNFTRGGFIVGGAFGSGILLAKQADKSWSPPAFVTLGGGGVGLQAGLSTAEMLVFIITDRGLSAVVNQEMRLGIGGGISLATIGKEMSAARALATGADIISIARSSGLYAGIALEGSSIAGDDDRNHAYYGEHPSLYEIVEGQRYGGQYASTLREMIARETR